MTFLLKHTRLDSAELINDRQDWTEVIATSLVRFVVKRVKALSACSRERFGFGRSRTPNCYFLRIELKKYQSAHNRRTATRNFGSSNRSRWRNSNCSNAKFPISAADRLGCRWYTYLRSFYVIASLRIMKNSKTRSTEMFATWLPNYMQLKLKHIFEKPLYIGAGSEPCLNNGALLRTSFLTRSLASV